MEYITYEAYGAVGDGVANDMPAIIAAHKAANDTGRPVKARKGAHYFIANKAASAVIHTDTDWTGARFTIDDRDLDNVRVPIFSVSEDESEPMNMALESLVHGQTQIDNPTGRELYVAVFNDDHLDYIRKGANENKGTARRDCFIVRPDGSLTSPVSFDFEKITRVSAKPITEKPLVLRGGEFTTIANCCESRYNYHSRNISITRSRVEVDGLKHYITGELDHGAPYSGFLSIYDCAYTDVHDCLFTGHKIYETIGAAGVRVSMGSYDISIGSAISAAFRRCSQTTDILDRGYWGLIGSNFCRDLLFEDCVFSRFDAHMGVTNCTLRRCKLGWQCLNAIGFGEFLIEETEALGHSFVNLRGDYGCTWCGSFTIRNSIWRPMGDSRYIFRAYNDGSHDFGYDCYLPQNIVIDGLRVESDKPQSQAYVFNDFVGKAGIEGEYAMKRPISVSARGITGIGGLKLCENDKLMSETKFTYTD